MNPKPPTLYSLLNSIANYGKEEQVKIRNLAKSTHSQVFDFEYELSEAIDKDDFECQILNHFMMRRIGFETFTAFQLYLENKLLEILPYYNIMFDSLANYNLFNDGEVITRSREDTGEHSMEGSNSVENRFSEYPLNQLEDISLGTYVSNQNTTEGTMSNSGTTSNTTEETTTRSVIDKMDLYTKYLQTKNSIMTLIYKDLDILFYGLGD